MEKKLTIFQITPFFYPNIGGVETHLSDLVKVLAKNHNVKVLTYQALVGKVGGKLREKSNNLEIIRIPWLPNFYYKSLKSPLLHFLYLTPRLLLSSIIYSVKNRRKIDILHAHGINAAFIGAIVKKFLDKPLIVSMHVEFNFKNKNRLTSALLWPLAQADKILTLTNSSKEELVRSGIPENKIKVYSYWVDQTIFKPLSKKASREKLNLAKNKFIALFVGRLAQEKGVDIILSLAEKLKEMEFVVVGFGDMANIVETRSKISKNLTFIGSIENKDLPAYYSAADLLLVPSLVKIPKPTFEEGIPRVIIESISCGTPVLGTDNGGIKEILEGGNVGIVTESSVEAFYKALKSITNKKQLSELKAGTRKFAVERFNEEGSQIITRMYKAVDIQNKLKPLLENTGDMALKRRTKWIFETLNLNTQDKVLDVGCGDGFYLHLLSTLGYKTGLTGTDFDARALESAKLNLRERNIRLLEGDLMKKLPFKDNSFDKIIMSEVTEHLPDDVKGLKEVYRILKPGGIACITVPHANYPFMWDPINWTLEHLFDTHVKSGFFAGIWNQHERLYEKDQIRKAVEKAGFKVQEQKYITWWCLPFSHYLINIGARVLAKNVSQDVVQGANKFKPKEQKSYVPGLYFTLANLIDKLNDMFPVRSGVSVVSLIVK